MAKNMTAMDGNSAAAHVAHACNEVIAIYPITPSSNMGEIADAKSAAGETNIWGSIPEVAELQSEGGASGAIHGALASGALATTFTASQGLLLMIPNMHKIAGELLPTTFHIAARSLACQALSIFGDHSDVMNCRTTGYCMLASGGVQEVMDIAMISTAACLEARLPFLHFFDGFRTSHEIQKIEALDKETMRAMIEEEFVIAHRRRGLSPDHPMMSGTSQNPDVYFQGRETVNKYYLAVPAIVEKYMKKFEKLTGRKYLPFQYEGSPTAEDVVILMGSAVETAHEAVDMMNAAGGNVGVLKVRLYRPFDAKRFIEALPKTVKRIAVLDRTKEPGCLGEPLYLDVVAAIDEMIDSKTVFKYDSQCCKTDDCNCHADGGIKKPIIIGGRYGLSSKEFTPGMVKAVFDNLRSKNPKNHFTVGIDDDVTNTSLPWDTNYGKGCGTGYQAMFWGLGSDGTVGANKNTIKIVAKATDKFVQGYFVYDSKKAGARTTSHLRFSDDPIRSTYLCQEVNFLACHNWSFVEKYNMLKFLKDGGSFLLNSPYDPMETWDRLPRVVQEQIIAKKADFYVLNGVEVAKKLGLGARINTLMQTAFFKLANVIPFEKAVEMIKDSIKKTYGKKGEEVVKLNYSAVDAAVENIQKVDYPSKPTSAIEMPPTVPDSAPDFVKNVTAKIVRLEGDSVKVSEMPADGQWPTATTQFEKRNIAVEIPVWEPEICIQCGQCSLVCPHAAIRIKIYDEKELKGALTSDNQDCKTDCQNFITDKCNPGAPATFKSAEAKTKAFAGKRATVQIAPEDCTGCGLCVAICPGKDKENPAKKAINLQSQFELRETEVANWDFFLALPETDPASFNKATLKGSQLTRPMFEFSGACAGCGETPYVKLVTQLFGDRALIDNATGCSSIYGGNLPTTPYCKRGDGLGPAWTNSLFEDAAEIGLGFRLTADRLKQQAFEQLEKAAYIPAELKQKLLSTDQTNDAGIEIQRGLVKELKALAIANKDPYFESLADYLVNKSVWVFGGDGWAYDIGYGGLDHVLASGKNVNLLVLDTEVYSNTGGQCSKSTARGSTARFAEAGKSMPKKDLGLMAQNYGYVYVAQVAMGANPNQTVKAFVEAESYDGPSIVICYSPCVNHGINMSKQLDQQKLAVDSGHWVLYRYDPRRVAEGLNPLQLDSKEPSIPITDYIYSEVRYRSLKAIDPERAAKLAKLAQFDVERRWNFYKQLSEMDFSWAKK